MPSRHLAAGVAGGSDADRETGVDSFVIGTGATTIPASADGDAGVVSRAATGDDDGLAAGVMADAVMADLGACVTLDAAIGDDGSAAAATTAGAIVAGASGRGCGARADGSITAGFGPVSYTHLRAHETGRNLLCRLL